MLKILKWKKATYPSDMWVSKFLSHENIFRLTRYNVALIVSESLKNKLELNSIKGIKFIEV